MKKICSVDSSLQYKKLPLLKAIMARLKQLVPVPSFLMLICLRPRRTS